MACQTMLVQAVEKTNKAWMLINVTLPDHLFFTSRLVTRRNYKYYV